MATRLELHEKLCVILGNRNVYYQPPETVKLKYPCIIYSSTVPDVKKASDTLYQITDCYDVLLIEKEPYSEVFHNLLKALPMCHPSRFFVSDGLYHKSFTLYFKEK